MDELALVVLQVTNIFKLLKGYRHQTGSMKYLGIPLKAGRLKVQDFKFLVDNVTRKLAGWRSNILSQAGRTVLIRSVLLSLPVYLASSLSIPKSICNQGSDGQHRRHWVAWSALQRPLVEGGLNFRNFDFLQVALAAKQIWNILHGDSLWSRYAKQRFLKQSHFSDIFVPFPLGISKPIFAKAKEVVLANIRWLGGDGSSVNFYKDTWIGPSPLMHVLRGNPSLAQESHNIMINEMVLDINNPVWSFLNVSPSYVHSLLSTSQDKFIWAANPQGNFTVKSAYDLAFSHGVSRGAWAKLWHHVISPRAAMFAWRLLHRAIPVSARIKLPVLVKWTPPQVDFCLNVDGASKGNSGYCGGGGCIRDSHGNFICGFAFFMVLGAAFWRRQGRSMMISVVFSDSATLLRAIAVGRVPHWSVFPWWRGILDMLQVLKPQLVHTFREGNQVADSLANFACSNASSFLFLELSSIPPLTRGSLLVDNAGLPSFRE
ncbi:hypothetical protein Taro_041025 [Colocasia esculenta]|uniref:Uncharacterized protein n=1 Tax=Colocasia esculenta TaxID=4460 RepID=A0A843WS66_COLES|nr:hypothetical protein [Colocasia esculenta]